MARATWGSLLLLSQFGFAFQPGVEIYRAGGSVSPPKILRKTEPHYTSEARRNVLQGTVVLEILVDERGNLVRSSVLSPLGFGLDERAQEAVSHWVFQPGLKDGAPVKTLSTVEVDFRLFHRWFDPKIEERRTAFNVAVDAIQGHRRTAEHLETIKSLAQQKYPPAMYLYAKLLESGDGFPQDPDQALRLILESAERNYAAAMYETGRMTLEGRRLPQDPERGLEMVRNAAVLGSRAAQFFLATAYENGSAVISKDTDRARQYFRMCASAGETACQIRLAQLLLARPDRQERDYVRAIAWLEIAAESGDAQAGILLQNEKAGLSEKQMAWVGKLKQQLGGAVRQ